MVTSATHVALTIAVVCSKGKNNMITSHALAKELEQQHSCIKTYVLLKFKEKNPMFPVMPPIGAYGSLDSKYPRWCYKLSDKQALFIKLSLNPNQLAEFLLQHKEAKQWD